jgi:hypothetical protein
MSIAAPEIEQAAEKRPATEAQKIATEQGRADSKRGPGTPFVFRPRSSPTPNQNIHALGGPTEPTGGHSDESAHKREGSQAAQTSNTGYGQTMMAPLKATAGMAGLLAA